MSNNIDLIETPERETISVNLQKKQVERLRAIKKARNISIARIVDQLIDEPLEKAYNKL